MNKDKKHTFCSFFVLTVFLTVILCAGVYADHPLKEKPDLTVKMKCKRVNPKAISYKMYKFGYMAEVFNKGKADARRFAVILMLTKKSKLQVHKVRSALSSKSPILGSIMVKLLKAGQSTVLHFRFVKIPTHIPSGEYELMAVADPYNRVREINEFNNHSTCPYFLKAFITKVLEYPTGESYGGELFPEVAIQGFHFGSAVGNKKVRFGSKTMSVRPIDWTSTQLFFSMGPHIECGRYMVYLVDGNRVISNKKNFLLRSWIAEILPFGGASPGSQVTINGRNFGATKGSKKVKFGSVEASVISWSTATIVAVVPAIPPGTYPVDIVVNGEDACSGIDFIVF